MPWCQNDRADTEASLLRSWRPHRWPIHSSGAETTTHKISEVARKGLDGLRQRFQKPAAPIQEPLRFCAAAGPSSSPNIQKIIESVPLAWIQQGRFSQKDIKLAASSEFSAARINRKLQEADRALAATTPILGQYAPTFGWPDDYGFYWEYLDAYLFIPEVAYAIKLKTRQVWKPGFEIETGSDAQSKKILKEYKRRKIFQSMFEATKNALIWGNSYIESVDDSQATWEQGQPADVAQGTAYTNMTYAPRPLIKFTPAKQFFGLKNTDPRTFRIQIQPQQWDPDKATVRIDKLIQRRWAGPLAPTAILGSETELDFHPEQMLLLQFNKITGGIYGYSTFRETIFALKGYILMLQFLPNIAAKRADATIHFKMGGNKYTETGQQVSTIPTNDEILGQKTSIESLAPGENIFTDLFTDSKELYTSRGGTERIDSLLQYYKERVLLGLGVPLTVATLGGGQEIKWGTLNFELMEDETREHQSKLEDLHNDYIIPRLLLNLRSGRALGDGPEVNFRFKEITPEDWRANEAPLADLYQRGIVSQEYVRQRLKIPQEAGTGTMFAPPPAPPPLGSDVKQPQEKLRVPKGEEYLVEGGWFRRRRQEEGE